MKLSLSILILINHSTTIQIGQGYCTARKERRLASHDVRGIGIYIWWKSESTRSDGGDSERTHWHAGHSVRASGVRRHRSRQRK